MKYTWNKEKLKGIQFDVSDDRGGLAASPRKKNRKPPVES